jgi:hypothetical protein
MIWLTYTKDDFNLLIGRLYNRRKKTHGGQVPGSRSGHFDHSFNRTAETIATEHGVSPKSVQRYGKFAEAVEEVQKMILTC